MKKLICIIPLIVFMIALCSCNNKKEAIVNEYLVTFVSFNEEVKKIVVKENELVSSLLIEDEYCEFNGWYKDNTLFDFTTPITCDIDLVASWNLFTLEEDFCMEQFENSSVSIKYAKQNPMISPYWEVSDKDVMAFNGCDNKKASLYALIPGKTEINCCITYKGCEFKSNVFVEVLATEFFIEYKLPDELESARSTLIDSYTYYDLPLALPSIFLDGYIFNGYKIVGTDKIITKINDETELDDYYLEPFFVFPYFNLSVNDPVITTSGETVINVSYVNIDEQFNLDNLLFEVKDDDIATVSPKGVIKGLKEGYTEVMVKLKSNNKINTSIGITINDKVSLNDELINLFISMNQEEQVTKKIKVYAWQKTYEHLLIASPISYLFEDLDIIENIAPITNDNRPGDVLDKYYVCVHDTGDYVYSASEWSEIVHNGQYDSGESYDASFQYVVGNDGVYHNIPDNEVAYHAGDGTAIKYSLTKTGVKGTNLKPTITISNDGYYEIDGVKSLILAPKNSLNEICKTSDINDAGIRCLLIDGEYQMGPTWYSSDYKKIANKGGNNNSIGIETCINGGTDIYYTWAKTAKLVAKLLDAWNLSLDDVVPHHYFSGKHCPQTMRANALWEYFKKMVYYEYQVLQYTKLGYKISFEAIDSEYLDNTGRIINMPSTPTVIKYKITITNEGYHNEIILSKLVKGTNTL